jgi:hypothetical protein
MSTIVQSTAFTIVCGVERNFRMPQRKKKTFAIGMLKEMMAEQGVNLDDEQLRRQVEWANWKRRLRKLCPFCPVVAPIQRLAKAFFGGQPRRTALI